MKERRCKTCGQAGHYAKTCGRKATAATVPVDRDVKPENIAPEAAPTTAATRVRACGICREPGHNAATCRKGEMPTSAPPARKPRSDRAERPAPRPSGFRLPLYLRPLPRQGGAPPPSSAPRPFEHVERIETDTTITHRWVSPDGRTITLTGRNRPIGCLSPQWRWEGRIVQRRVVDAAHARRGCPTFTVKETGP